MKDKKNYKVKLQKVIQESKMQGCNARGIDTGYATKSNSFNEKHLPVAISYYALDLIYFIIYELLDL